MIINLEYEQDALAAPQSFRDGMQIAADMLDAAFTDNIVVNISVGYGTYNGTPLQNQNVSVGGFSNGTTESYSGLKSLLSSDATTSIDHKAVASLPGGSSIEGHSAITISSAQEKALGLLTSDSTILDGQVGMGTGFTGDVLIAGALHELTHAMGRTNGSSLDLFRYNEDHSGTHVFGSAIPATPAYFSIDGGNTKLADFGISSDPGDFLNSGVQGIDPFNETVGGNKLTTLDLNIMDVLGFDKHATPTPKHMLPTLIGQIGDVGIYRVDLGASGLSSVGSITVHDDNVISGGTGGASGFDLDFIEMSDVVTADAATAASQLPGQSGFDFSSAGVVFNAGFLSTWHTGDNAIWNTAQLFGTTGSQQYSEALATLSALDGSNGSPNGEISLGEGGSITFSLTGAVSTQGRYLYFGDVGGGNDSCYITASSSSTQPAPSGLHLTGTSGDDVMQLGTGANAHLGTGNDLIRGSDGNDLISSVQGSDTLYGNSGNDSLLGGIGQDHLFGGSGDDQLMGDGGQDRLRGGGGADMLYGEAGADHLFGDAGADLLNGGNGNDILTGGFGADTFVFSDGFGHDTITDFSSGDNEKIDLSHVADSITKFAQLVHNHITTDTATGFAVIHDGANTIELDGIHTDQIGFGLAYSAHDFIF